MNPCRQHPKADETRLGDATAAFLFAASRGFLGDIQRAVAAGAHLHGRSTFDQETAAHYAARGGHADAIDLLHALGSPIDLPDGNGGYTPMHVAAYEGHANVIRALRRSGAGLDTPSFWFEEGPGDGGSTPLHRAVQAIALHAAEVLLELGACPNRRSQRGNLPAHGMPANPALLLQLLDAGTDPRQVNDLGRSVAEDALASPLLADVMRSWLARASAFSAIELLNDTQPVGIP